MAARKNTKQSEETRKKISLTCKQRGVGKWMLGKKQSEETKQKKRNKQNEMVAKGIHNFWKGGREQKYCADCKAPITYYRTKCVKCAPAKKENHWNWKGGITEPNHALRTSILYKEWRESVFERDNYKCKINSSDCVHEVHAHHILRFAEYPELRFDINNGITLCENHHPMKKFQELKLAPYFQSLIAV
mgnify:CR=1 FL=1